MNNTFVRMHLIVTRFGMWQKGCALWRPCVFLGVAEQDGVGGGYPSAATSTGSAYQLRDQHLPVPRLAGLFLVMALSGALPVFAEETRNPFQFEIAPPPPPVVEQPIPKKEPRPTKPKEPAFVWQIQGIFQSEKGNMALLNYRFVSVGDVIRGWTVHAITDKSVRLRKEGVEIKVRFEE